MQNLQNLIESKLECKRVTFYEHDPCCYYVNKSQVKICINGLKIPMVEEIIENDNAYIFKIDLGCFLDVCKSVSYVNFINTESKVLILENGCNPNHQQRINYVGSILNHFHTGKNEISVGKLDASDIGISNCANAFNFENDEFANVKLHCTFISTKRSQFLKNSMDSIYISYTFARVYRILQNIDPMPQISDVDISLFSKDAKSFLHILCEYEYYLSQFIKDNDPFYLYSYLSKLSKIVGKVHKNLRVKDVKDLALKQSRAFLFIQCYRIMDELFVLLSLDKIKDI